MACNNNIGFMHLLTRNIDSLDDLIYMSICHLAYPISHNEDTECQAYIYLQA
jgi:hypothetical protein